MLRTTLLIIALSLVVDSTAAAPPPTGVPAFDASLRNGLNYLKAQMRDDKLHGGERSFAAYALLKGGEASSSPLVLEAIEELKSRFKDGKYTVASRHPNYEAGVQAMLLADADPTKYFNEVTAIADYLISKQGADGSWDYDARDVGDTSQSQFAILGLWAASRANVEIPMEVWDKAAMWHIRSQRPDGGFMYMPGRNKSADVGGPNSTLNMTAGASSTLGILRDMLYPNARLEEVQAKKKKAFGVLEAKQDPSTIVNTGKPRTSQSAIEGAIRKAIGWVTSRYTPLNSQQPAFPFYYAYALERACALNGIERLGGRIDWYQQTGRAVLQRQQQDGGWGKSVSGEIPAATFACLFFIRPTKKIVAEQYGAGLLMGGRGLPSDLANADISGGAVKEKRKIEGPLDQLLTELSTLNPESLADAQAAIVEKVQLGNREELIGELDRIRKLIDHPNEELRRTAVWAVGRSGNLKDANLLITRLREDFNVDVLVEAYNSLSYLSRKIDGVGMNPSPFFDLEEGATQAQKDSALKIWRKEAVARWSAWYLRIRPYKDRNDLFELGLAPGR